MEMKTITQDELDEMIKKHELWLKTREEGETLKLESISLENLKIHDCNLGGCEFRNVKMSRMVFENVDFHASHFFNVKIGDSHITNANMKACIILDSSIKFSTLNNTNLELATIEHTMFGATKMHNINLLNSDLDNVALAGCKLDGNLYEASFNNLIITRSTLNDLIYQMGPIGSRKAYTTYFANKDNVRCGCWKEYKGGTLEEFKKEVEKTYPFGEYHDEYMIAIEAFKKYRELYLKSKNGDK